MLCTLCIGIKDEKEFRRTLGAVASREIKGNVLLGNLYNKSFELMSTQV